MKVSRSLALCFIAGLTAAANAQLARVEGTVWGGNVAGGQWYLRDTPTYQGQPCYYIESSQANWGYGGVASVYGATMCRVSSAGHDSIAGMAYTDCGSRDSVTITAPGIATGTPGTLTANFVIQFSVTANHQCTGCVLWNMGQVRINLGTSPAGNEVYTWGANLFNTGWFVDDYGTIPPPPIPPTVPVTYEFQYGVPFQLLFWSALSAGTGNYGPPDSVAIGAQLLASWGDISSVTADGIPITNYHIAALSGTDYTQPSGLCGSPCGGPPIVLGPYDAKACPGGQTTLTVTAVSTQPLAYQWRKSGTPIPGARSAQLLVNTDAAADAGVFDCIVSSGCSTITSQPAIVSFCYANCDGSTTSPTLNVLDFTCFLNRFASGSTLANCDGSTVAPILNVNDFTCFLNMFAAGCS